MVVSSAQAVYAYEDSCETLDLENLYQSVRAYDVIAIVKVGNFLETTPESVELNVEAYLKGPPNVHILVPVLSNDHCAAELHAGARMLVALKGLPGVNILWPSYGSVFFLENGSVFNEDGLNIGVAEADLIKDVRAVTGQFAVPANSLNDAASLDLVSVIIPVLIVAVCILGIGLILQRIWQRIDPE
tara:strand:- start:2111 stop:2671 length:561 start_codon:yes stop_codon:yes gene_type:complete